MQEEERKYGPYAFNLYKSVLKDGTEEDSSIRINVVGNFRQGKTSLVMRLIGKDNKNVQSTNGIDIVNYRCKQDSFGNIMYEENPGIDAKNIAKRMKQAAIGEPSLEQKTKSKRIKRFFVNPFRKKMHPKHEMHRPVGMSEEDRYSFVKEVSKPNDQHSFNDNADVPFDIWDFGGQYVFYATHTLFHSRKAIYLLVFNLSCGLTDIVPNDEEECCVNMGERTMEYYIRFWVNSIHSFVGNEDGTEPKIILVGTHLDKLKGDDHSKKKQADTYFDNIRKLFKGKQTLKHIFPQDFALDTKTGAYETFNDFRKALLCVGQLYTTTTEVPAKWIQLEKMLFSRREMKIIEFGKLMEIDSRSEFPLRDPEQVKVFLKHQHDQGTLFYFDEEPISEYVVLDPQFLVDAFKGLITADRFLMNRPDVYDLFQTLKAEGKLEPELIEKLWTNGEDKLIFAHKRTILWFLQKHRIISEAMEFDETNLTAVGLGWYVIPSLLKDHSQVGEMTAFLRDRKQTKIQFVVSFDSSSVVPTVYHRLTAAVIGRWPIAEFRKRKLLFENLSVVRLGHDHAGILEMNDRHIHLYVVNLSPPRNVIREIPDRLRRFTESVITYEFRKYKGKRKDMNLPYTRGYVCNHESHEVSCSKRVSLFTQLDTTSSLLCPDTESHSRIDTVEAKDEWYLGNKIPDISSNVVVSEQMISELSQTIGWNWELLVPELELKQVKIDHIIEENPKSTGMKIYKMLQLWLNEKRNFATLDALIKILKKRSDVHVDWDGIMNIVDRLNQSEQDRKQHNMYKIEGR